VLELVKSGYPKSSPHLHGKTTHVYSSSSTMLQPKPNHSCHTRTASRHNTIGIALPQQYFNPTATFPVTRGQHRDALRPDLAIPSASIQSSSGQPMPICRNIIVEESARDWSVLSLLRLRMACGESIFEVATLFFVENTRTNWRPVSASNHVYPLGQSNLAIASV
jgi:hypothetical protein